MTSNKLITVEDYLPPPGDGNWNVMRKKNDLFKQLFHKKYQAFGTHTVSPSGIDNLPNINKKTGLSKNFKKLIMLKKNEDIFNKESFRMNIN